MVKNMAYAMCCDCCATLDVKNDAICCNVRCGGVKSRCGGVNVMWNVVQWWCAVEWCVRHERCRDVKSFPVM